MIVNERKIVASAVNVAAAVTIVVNAENGAAVVIGAIGRARVVTVTENGIVVNVESGDTVAVAAKSDGPAGIENGANDVVLPLPLTVQQITVWTLAAAAVAVINHHLVRLNLPVTQRALAFRRLD